MYATFAKEAKEEGFDKIAFLFESVAMIPVAEINRTTGYIRGGCSPMGMKKLFPTVFDRAVAVSYTHLR